MDQLIQYFIESANSLSVIWFIFFCLFLVMAIREFKKSTIGIEIRRINLGFSDLNEAYEVTRQGIIEADKDSHRIAATSYFLASLTALASLIISLL